MAKAPRTLEVTYGAFVVSSANDREIDELVSFGEGQDDGFFEFSCVISKDTEAAFITEANAFETAFRTPRLRLQVILTTKEPEPQKTGSKTQEQIL